MDNVKVMSLISFLLEIINYHLWSFFNYKSNIQIIQSLYYHLFLLYIRVSFQCVNVNFIIRFSTMLFYVYVWGFPEYLYISWILSLSRESPSIMISKSIFSGAHQKNISLNSYKVKWRDIKIRLVHLKVVWGK